MALLQLWARLARPALATTCACSTAQLPKVLGHLGALRIFTSKSASGHNGVHFFISQTARFGKMAPHPPLLRAYFSTLRSHKTLEKHFVSWLFYLVAHLHLLSSDSFSFLIFFLLPFSSLTLPTSAFPSVHIVRSLTSKLPWINEDPISSNVKQYLFQANVDACGYDIETWVGHTAHVWHWRLLAGRRHIEHRINQAVRMQCCSGVHFCCIFVSAPYRNKWSWGNPSVYEI